MNNSRCLAASLLFALCSSVTAHAFEVTSPVFEDGGQLPQVYACSKQGGQDMSWEIDIRDVPAGAVSLVVIMDNPDAQPVAGRTWVHWNVSNLPADTKSLPSKKKGKGIGKLGNNSSRSRGYQGMCPPNGEHKYVLVVYALNAEFKKRLDKVTRERIRGKIPRHDYRESGN